MENLRNIVILKNLPSNLIEEAFVVLKKNQKVKNIEYIENNSKNFINERGEAEESDFIIKEAELLLSDYVDISNNEEELVYWENDCLCKKYKNMKKCTITLACILFITLLYIFV